MKAFLLLMTISFLSFVTKGQTSQDKEAVKKVVITFQEDFNDGSFKNAAAYSTTDWEHIDPGGGIDNGRQRFKNCTSCSSNVSERSYNAGRKHGYSFSYIIC